MNEGIKYFLSKGRKILKPVIEKSNELGIVKAMSDPVFCFGSRRSSKF
ncbi:hypothetical protein [Listeria booriae]|uniref:Uncharacterized protein n=1 Tax=Listeria booriae TaxID=1552123 RepID=A0A7X1DLR6_9LIST|nr:hypothetical protein [Listeria booriae]MBC1286756.1 hypothetical protein [Listeria booriae]MBC1889105.1 hypothetical protein [Listeria booriae]MBC2240609.1 hypothetical protein [Listeria booriae]MBC2283779.1 hypothetical protein [Listeria booriae]MBC2292125.1 hypothetical protein [Listeria booriae]